MPRLIGHLDADCFYVSAERVRYRHLMGQAVGVLGNQGACVIAKSYELKAMGIRTGQPIWEVVPVCPEAIFVKRDFRWYEVLSRKMLDIIRQVSPEVEYYSIDEFFFDASHLVQSFGLDLESSIMALQNRILSEVGVPVSIGVSWSRTLAKLMSDANKPFGVKVLLETNEINDFLEEQPISEVSGIGRKSALKLAAIGINTCLDFTKANRQMIQRLLTVKGEALWFELQGEAVIPIQTEKPQNKRVSRGGSMGESTNDPVRLNAWLARNTERLVDALDSQKLVCQRIVLWLEYKGSGGFLRSLKLPFATAKFETIFSAAQVLLESFRGSNLVCGMHIESELLSPRHRRQLSLFEKERDRRTQLKQEINEKLGRFAVRSGVTLHLPEMYADISHDYDICDVQGKTCF